MTEIKDFFIKDNTIKSIPNEAYDDINQTIEDIDAFSRSTYKSVYVIDYYKQNFLYVSDNPVFLCGMSAEEVKELGYNFYINHVPPEDLELLLEINRVGFQFLNDIPIEENKDYTLSYDFHIVNKDSNRKRLINHQITPLRFTDSGQLWLGLCAASISSANKPGNIVISKKKSKEYWLYNQNTKRWEIIQRPELKDMEKDVLKLSAMGYTMNEIAAEVNRSFNTVKSYRKSLFQKLGVNNITEAINIGMNHRLI